jgi:large subunit ribosomal protein L21
VAAVIQDRGRQYVVSDGTSLLVDHLDGAEAGAEHVFDKVLAIDGDFGAPFLDGAKVVARVDGAVRGKKLHVHKFRRRKDYRRRIGHRQDYTRLTITSINK